MVTVVIRVGALDCGCTEQKLGVSQSQQSVLKFLHESVRVDGPHQHT